MVQISQLTIAAISRELIAYHCSSAWFNDITYVRPKVPTLYTALSTGESAMDPNVYGSSTNTFVLQKGQVVEIILNNFDPGKHPFHLHGHAFQTIVRSPEEAGAYVYNETFPKVPMRRDTVMARPNGNLVLRFRADNPGIWLFHCHIEWHVASGLVATMVEAPDELQKSLKIPQDHLDACAAKNIPVAGNAAGNTVDFMNLKGENLPPAPLPAGFTAKGIVALVFSVLAAFLGMAVISWYVPFPGITSLEVQPLTKHTMQVRNWRLQQEGPCWCGYAGQVSGRLKAVAPKSWKPTTLPV